MALVKPPLIQYLVLENPYLISGALAVLSVLILMLGWNRASRRLVITAVVIVISACGAYLLAVGVETDRERIILLTENAVGFTASQPMDLDGLRGLIDRRIALTRQGGDGLDGFGYEDIFAAFEDFSRRGSIRQQTVKRVDGQIDAGGRGLTLLELRTMISTDMGDSVIQTNWLLTWSQDSESEWKMIEVHWMEHPAPNGLNPDSGLLR